MIRSLLFSITAAGVALSAPLVTYVSAPREVVAKEESASAAELVSCFDYYRFGSVQVDMQPETPSTVTGVPLRFTGTISNQNEYPLVDGAVYVKVFKIDPTAEKNTAGPDVVAQFFVKKNIALAAKASAPLEFTWQVPGYAVSGDYRLASFFTAADKFNVLGLSFTDDVVGNMADFSIQGEQRGIVAFNKQAVTLNDDPYHFAAFPPQFERERDVTITAAVTNSTSQPHTIPVTWKLYAWDALREENVVAEANETVTVAAGNTATTTFIATDSAHPVYYAVGTVHYKDTTSTIGVRFVREAVQRTRINFPALTAFPLKANTEATVFSCLHGMGPDEAIPGGKLVLKVADRAGNPIHTTTYEGEVTGAMMGVRGTFVPTEDYHRLTVRAELYQDTNLVDEATMTYDCATLNPDQCPAEEAAPVAGPGQSTKSPGTLFGWLAILGILIVGGLTLFIRGRARSTSAALVLVIAGALGLLAPSEAAAASVSWSKTVDAQFGYRGTFTDRTGSLLSEWWILGLRTPTITVTYKARVINMETGALIKKGDTIPVFSDIRFEFEPHLFTDIHWFGTGFSLDSPYGDWIANAAAPTPVGPLIENIIPSGPLAGPTGQFRPTNQCLDKDYVGINNSGNPAYKPYIPLAVNPPLKTIAGLNNLVCQEPESNGSVVCAVVTPGRIAGHFEFKPTQGKFYYRYFDDNVDACFGTNEPMRFAPHGENAFIATELLGSNRTTTGGRDFTLDVPVQTIPFDFTAVGVAPNLLPPNTPIIEGPTTGVINETYGFTVKTTDPQNAQVQYGLDWTGDNVVDQWLPSATVFVPHNTPQPFSRLWTTVGQQTFRAKARNGHGLESGWATHTITLTEPAPSPTAAVWCSPATQTIQAGSTASFTHALQQAVSWRAPGGTPPSATNIAAFSTRYDAAGTYTASIVPPLFYDVTGDGSITIDDANAVFQNQGATTGPGNGSPWQNPANRFDVNADGFVTPLDGHAIGTYLNNTGAGPLPQLTCQVQVLPGEVTPTPTPTATPTPTPTATPTATPTPTTTPRTSGGPFLPGPVREDE